MEQREPTSKPPPLRLKAEVCDPGAWPPHPAGPRPLPGMPHPAGMPPSLGLPFPRGLAPGAVVPGRPFATYVPLLPSPEVALERSAIAARFPVLPIGLTVIVLLGVGTAIAEPPDTAARIVQGLLALFMMAVVTAGLILWTAYSTRRVKDEEEAVGRAESAVRIRRFDLAAWELSVLLTTGMLSPLNRIRALGAYVATLTRLGRFDDVARMVDEMLSEGVLVNMVGSLRAQKAYALLREDRLVDADRAVTDIRKMGRTGAPGAMLAITECYRDLRTGHAEDILLSLDARRAAVAGVLGPRVADLDAMAAWAALQRNEPELAARLWKRATLLAAPAELADRYPEVGLVAAKLPATPLPVEVTAPQPSEPSLSRQSSPEWRPRSISE